MTFKHQLACDIKRRISMLDTQFVRFGLSSLLVQKCLCTSVLVGIKGVTSGQ